MDAGGAFGTGVGASSGGRWSLVVGGRAASVVGGVGVGLPSSTTMSESQIVKSGGGTALAVSEFEFFICCVLTLDVSIVVGKTNTSID